MWYPEGWGSASRAHPALQEPRVDIGLLGWEYDGHVAGVGRVASWSGQGSLRAWKGKLGW